MDVFRMLDVVGLQRGRLPRVGVVSADHRSVADGRIGILSALPEELEHLARDLAVERADRRAGLLIRQGRLDGQPVALAECGIGKVNAALAATVLCDALDCRALVLSGVAGGVPPDLGVGDLVVATRIVDLDYGRATDAGLVPCRPGIPPLPGGADPGDPSLRLRATLEEAVRAALVGVVLPEIALRPGEAPHRPRIALGTIATGDAFVASERVRDAIARDHGALAVEMEGSAIAGVAERFGIPWLVIRALSDRAGTSSGVDFAAFGRIVATSAALVVRALLPVLAGTPAPGSGCRVSRELPLRDRREDP